MAYTQEFLTIRQEIEALAENDYKQFSASLMPGVERVLGVRLPQLRQLARKVAGGDWAGYLAQEPYYFDELMLQGMVIGAVRTSDQERIGLIRDFVPKINSWAVCDTFCSGLKFTAKRQSLMWDVILPYLDSGQTYQIRFAVVMLMDYYLDETYIDPVLSLLTAVDHQDYYVKMAVAWALATALAKQPEKTWALLCRQQEARTAAGAVSGEPLLDEDTWKKMIQKCLESRRISEEMKETLRSWRSGKKT